MASVASSDFVGERQQRLGAAVAFLRRHCILVDVVDRQALVRRYRVSGKREPMFAEDVIEHAVNKGMAAACGVTAG